MADISELGRDFLLGPTSAPGYKPVKADGVICFDEISDRIVAIESAIAPTSTPVDGVIRTGLVATRGAVPTASSATNKQLMSRTRHYARDRITAMQLLFGNIYVPGLEASGPGSITLTAAIEYPAGTYYQVKWSGSTSVTIAPGDIAPLSDNRSVKIPDGGKFWIRTWVTGASGIIYAEVKHIMGEDVSSIAASGLSDLTMGGTITDTAGTYACFPPLAIVGPTARRTVLIVGDSRNGSTASIAHFNALSDKGNIAHAISSTVAYTNAARSGQTMGQVVSTHALLTALSAYTTDVMIQHGINDINGGASLSSVTSRLTSIVGYFSETCRVWTITIEPISTSSDGWTTVGGQLVVATNPNRTAFNDFIRAGVAGATGYFEFADYVETGRNSGIWRIFETGIAPTSDGVHMNDAGHTIVDKIAPLDPRIVAGIGDTVPRIANRDQWDSGEGPGVMLTPASINRARYFGVLTADQTGNAAGSTVTVLWSSVTGQGGGYYVASSGRLYPPKGLYCLNVQTVLSGVTDGAGAALRCYVYATLVLEVPFTVKGTSNIGIGGTIFLQFDGVADYLEIKTNVTGSTTAVVGSGSRTFFQLIAQ